jgi:SAM-dependent methyltransferase
MSAWRLVPQRLLLTAALLATAGALAQPAGEYKPSVGQAGKDVVWVPTSNELVAKMLDMAKVTAKDYVIDLGSGDGRTVIAAAKRGARALGIEYNPDMVELSKQNAAKEGVGARATFVKADLFESDFSQATVITMFLLPDINKRLRPKILSLKPGTRIVSNSFDMGDWEADETGTAVSEEGSSYYRTALLWIVPAKVDGKWKSAAGEIAFQQQYQMVSGTINAGNVSTLISGGRLRGDKITFTAGGAQYSGKVRGNSISGTVTRDGGTAPWQATRLQ